MPECLLKEWYGRGTPWLSSEQSAVSYQLSVFGQD